MLRPISMHNHRPLVDLNHISKVVTREVDLTSSRLTLAIAHLQPTQVTVIIRPPIRIITSSILTTRTTLLSLRTPTTNQSIIMKVEIIQVITTTTTLQVTAMETLLLLHETAVAMVNTAAIRMHKVTYSSHRITKEARQRLVVLMELQLEQREPNHMIQQRQLLKEVVVMVLWITMEDLKAVIKTTTAEKEGIWPHQTCTFLATSTTVTIIMVMATITIVSQITTSGSKIKTIQVVLVVNTITTIITTNMHM